MRKRRGPDWHLIGSISGLVVFAILFIVFALMDAGRENLYYEDRLRTQHQIEEILADKLEVENPEYDIEVSISVQVDE
jgi:hypothetical protein